MGRPETAQLLLETLHASRNDDVDRYIAGLRALLTRKAELASYQTLGDLESALHAALEVRTPAYILQRESSIAREASEGAWHAAVLIRRILHGEFDPNGAYALPAVGEVAA